MALRTAHGKARKHGALVMVETLPPDELPAATPVGPDQSGRNALGQFVAGNNLGRTGRARAGIRGELGKLEAQADPSWKSADRWSKQWAAHRRTELARLHGGELSSGVCAMVEDARQAMRDARWCASKAASIEQSDPDRAASLRSEARQLRIEARGHGLASWEIAANEARGRPQESAADKLRRRAGKAIEAKGESGS